jgi:hypothetical protein
MKRLFPSLCFFSYLITLQSFAGSATWSENPVSDDWYTAENWSPATVPNGPDDVATIGKTTTVLVTLPEQSVTELNALIFGGGSTVSGVDVSSGATLTLLWTGIVDKAGKGLLVRAGSDSDLSELSQ